MKKNNLVTSNSTDEQPKEFKILLIGGPNQERNSLEFKGKLLFYNTQRPFIPSSYRWIQENFLEKDISYKDIKQLDNPGYKTEFQFYIYEVEEENKKKYLIHEYFVIKNCFPFPEKCKQLANISRAWTFDNFNDFFNTEDPYYNVADYLNDSEIETMKNILARKISLQDLKK